MKWILVEKLPKSAEPSVAWVLHCGVRRNRQKNVEISSVASQLSVSLPGDQSKLNGKHVVLGRVVQGMEAPWKAMESTKGYQG